MNPRHNTHSRAKTRARNVAAPGPIETLGPYEIDGIGSRRVRVYVPRGEAKRSVVILFDGQNVFGDEGSFGGGWHAHRAAERVVTKKRPAPIVVAIDHGGVERIEELSPFTAGEISGRLDQQVAFLRDVLARDVRARFAIPHDPGRWIIGGSSMGGLAALYTHFAIPEIFGRALCMSPSLWFAGRSIFPWIASRSMPLTSRIYLDCGVREGNGGLLPLATAMAALLRSRGHNDSTLRLRVDRRGSHSESSWRRRLPGALRFLLR